MNILLDHINQEVYNKLKLKLTHFHSEIESKEYDASNFSLSGKKVVYRTAKITPKKIGQFVTFWKRSNNGPIEPFHEKDNFDFFVVTVTLNDRLGQFVFPKAVLLKKGIVSTISKEGKRAFRVYPIWDTTSSNQAMRTQKWQLDFFYELNKETDFNYIYKLFEIH